MSHKVLLRLLSLFFFRHASQASDALKRPNLRSHTPTCAAEGKECEKKVHCCSDMVCGNEGLCRGMTEASVIEPQEAQRKTEEHPEGPPTTTPGSPESGSTESQPQSTGTESPAESTSTVSPPHNMSTELLSQITSTALPPEHTGTESPQQSMSTEWQPQSMSASTVSPPHNRSTELLSQITSTALPPEHTGTESPPQSMTASCATSGAPCSQTTACCDIDDICCDTGDGSLTCEKISEPPLECLASDPPTSYNLKLLNDASSGHGSFGNVIARDLTYTHYPAIIKIPQFVKNGYASNPRTHDMANPAANYYMYYGRHSGTPRPMYIHMKWAENIEGPWYHFNLDSEAVCDTDERTLRCGVMDFAADESKGSNHWSHIDAPDIIIKEDEEEIIMFFHGKSKRVGKIPGHHANFVATSKDGLNFNDPQSGGGVPGYGPKCVVDGDGNCVREICIAEDYQRVFVHPASGVMYSLSKRGVLSKPKNEDAIFEYNPRKPWSCFTSWEMERTKADIWTCDANQGTDGPEFFRGQTKYRSPIATWLASRQFANHPNNPVPGTRVTSNGQSVTPDDRINRVGLGSITEDLLEVFFWIKDGSNGAYDDIYRMFLDISDPDYRNWHVACFNDGRVFFDVVATQDGIQELVRHENGYPTVDDIDADKHAKPHQLGDPFVYIDDMTGRKYLFYSYSELDDGPGIEGEGQISVVKLVQ